MKTGVGAASAAIFILVIVLANVVGIGVAAAGVPNISERPACMVFSAGHQKHYIYLEYIPGEFNLDAQAFGRWSQSVAGTWPVSGAWIRTTDHWETGPRLISLTGNSGGTTCDASITLSLNPDNYTVDGKLYVKCTSQTGAVKKYQGYLTGGSGCL